MGLELALTRLQRWFQAVVVHPGTTEEAVSGAAATELAPERLPDVILASSTLTPLERIAIYQGMYPFRMEEALATDYPGLKHFLGDEGFFELVRAYVQVHPSRSYTLNHLGDHFPEFVSTAPGLKRRDFCHDLAQLELAVTQVFDAPEVAPLSAEQIAAVPFEAWGTARLQPVAAFRLLRFRYAVNAYLQTVRDDSHDHPKPRRKDAWVAIYRRHYGVYRLDLTKAGHDLLQDLVSGSTLGDAIAQALGREKRHAPSEEELFRWFREWVAGGVFRSVAHDGAAS
jgi:hypothetical protein